MELKHVISFINKKYKSPEIKRQECSFFEEKKIKTFQNLSKC